MNIYFDTNVFIHSYERNYEITPNILQELREAVESGKVTILLSVYNLEEVLQYLRSSQADAISKIGHLLDLTDREKIIKPADRLVPDVIRSYAFDGPISIPYIQIGAETAAKLQALRNPNETTLGELSSILEETRNQIEEFKAGVIDANKQTLLAKKNLIHGNLPFNVFFEKTAPHWAEVLADRAGVLTECKKRGIDGLLKLKTVGMAVGVNLSYVYALTFEKCNPKDSDSRDILHAIAATAADIFVSHDKRLRRLIARIPNVTFKTLDFHGLLHTIREIA